MTIVHLTASTFFGGPERQMLGLAESLAPAHRTAFLTFSEGGRCEAFLERVRQQGFEARALSWDTPYLRAATRALTAELVRLGADVLLCHGYKPNLLGRPAARRAGVPVVAVSRGWTAESRKIRVYESLDRLNLGWMDRVVCVSEGQAVKVRRAGVRNDRVVVIRNAIRADRFLVPDPEYGPRLRKLFATPPARIIGAAGRLSPEKGFGDLVSAAEVVSRSAGDVGFVLFGEGPLREELARRIDGAGLGGRFLLAGFRTDLDQFVPHLDLMVLPSYTEGLPNVALEALAAGVPVVATAVGGTPEVVEDGVCGRLVPPGDPGALAAAIGAVLADEAGRREMGDRGRRRIREQFTFEAQARQYESLLSELTGSAPEAAAAPRTAAAQAVAADRSPMVLR